MSVQRLTLSTCPMSVQRLMLSNARPFMPSRDQDTRHRLSLAPNLLPAVSLLLRAKQQLPTVCSTFDVSARNRRARASPASAAGTCRHLNSSVPPTGWPLHLHVRMDEHCWSAAGRKSEGSLSCECGCMQAHLTRMGKRTGGYGVHCR